MLALDVVGSNGRGGRNNDLGVRDNVGTICLRAASHSNVVVLNCSRSIEGVNSSHAGCSGGAEVGLDSGSSDRSIDGSAFLPSSTESSHSSVEDRCCTVVSEVANIAFRSGAEIFSFPFKSQMSSGNLRAYLFIANFTTCKVLRNMMISAPTFYASTSV